MRLNYAAGAALADAAVTGASRARRGLPTPRITWNAKLQWCSLHQQWFRGSGIEITFTHSLLGDKLRAYTAAADARGIPV